MSSKKDEGNGHHFFTVITESPEPPLALSPESVGSVVELFDPLLVPVVVVTLPGLSYGERTNRDEILESVSD